MELFLAHMVGLGFELGCWGQDECRMSLEAMVKLETRVKLRTEMRAKGRIGKGDKVAVRGGLSGLGIKQV